MKCWAVAAVGFAVICASALIGFIAHDYIIAANPFKAQKQSQNSTHTNVTSSTTIDPEIETRVTDETKLPPVESQDNSNSSDAAEYLEGISTELRIDSLGTRLQEPVLRPYFPIQPYIIGLTGGIASGKSTLSQHFQTLGAAVIDCDKLAHKVYEPRTYCHAELVNHFGNDILNGNLQINRTKLGEIVFADKQQLQKLNEIVWPSLGFEVQNQIEAFRKTHSVIILEAAVLLQAKWQSKVHEVWSVIVPTEMAIQRLVKRNNLTEEQAKQRIAMQPSNDEMVKESTVIFSTQWGYESAYQQAEKAWSALQEHLKTVTSKP